MLSSSPRVKVTWPLLINTPADTVPDKTSVALRDVVRLPAKLSLEEASRESADEPPAWYRNLTANPDVEVQVGADRFRARARTAGPDEKPALWREMVEIWPAYDDYQQHTDRDIPVVVLERAD